MLVPRIWRWLPLVLLSSGASAETGLDPPLRLLRYGPAGQERPALLDAHGQIRDLSRVIADITPAALAPASLARLAALDPEKLPRVTGQPRLGYPINGIRKIIGIGLNYAEHARESGSEPPKQPIIFLKAITALNGPNDAVIRPKGATALDYEAELVIVIGKPARYINEAEAGDYIAGYAVGNDVSERDFQLRRDGQWTKGKSADTFAPLGPYVVAAKGVKQDQLDIWLKVNGQTRQHSNTTDMIFKPHFLVSYLSQYMTLEPGDVIYTGTPPGVGNGMKPPVYLQPGDLITLGIEGLGEQRQQVIAWESTTAAPASTQLAELERRRVVAINQGDIATLQNQLSDDYLHVHGTGKQDGKQGFIDNIQARPRQTERGELTIRVYGDNAVITGELSNRGANAETGASRYYATQVAHRTGHEWQWVSMQLTPLRDSPAPSNVSDASPVPSAMTAGSDSKPAQAVLALEAKRTAAIATGDFSALADTLAEDYLHVFGGGNRTDKNGYLDTVRAAPRVPSRGPLTVRLYGEDFAVITGDLLNRIHDPGKPERVLDTRVTQVARRSEGRWRFVSFAITPKTPNTANQP